MISLARKGHVMQQSLLGGWIRVSTGTKMQIRSKAEKSSFPSYQNVLILATSHHSADSITEQLKYETKHPLRFF